MQILSIVRRFLRKPRILGAARQYFLQISQRVPRSQLIRHRLALWMCVICAIGPAFFLVPGTGDRQVAGLIGVLVLGAAWIGVRHFRLSQFGLVTGLFLKGPFRQIIDLQSRLEEFERSLANARDVEQCWETIQAECREFGFNGGRLRVRGRVFETGSPPPGISGQWQLRVPLAEAQYVNLYRDPQAEDHPAVIGKLAGILREGLQARLADWDSSVPRMTRRLQTPPAPVPAPLRSFTAAAR